MSTARRHRCDPLVPWEVPRDFRVTVPEGLQWAAPGRPYLVGPSRPPQLIRLDDWGQEVAVRACALMLVSRVRVGVDAPAADHWARCSQLFTLKPAVFHVAPGGFVKVSPSEGRTGELWAFPMEELAGPPKPRRVIDLDEGYAHG